MPVWRDVSSDSESESNSVEDSFLFLLFLSLFVFNVVVDFLAKILGGSQPLQPPTRLPGCGSWVSTAFRTCKDFEGCYSCLLFKPVIPKDLQGSCLLSQLISDLLAIVPGLIPVYIVKTKAPTVVGLEVCSVPVPKVLEWRLLCWPYKHCLRQLATLTSWNICYLITANASEKKKQFAWLEAQDLLWD